MSEFSFHNARALSLEKTFNTGGGGGDLAERKDVDDRFKWKLELIFPDWDSWEACFAKVERDLWIVGNLVGLAMGASQSIGRALVGQFTPVERTGEFFGLWGLANRLAALLGPMSYGLVNYLTDGNHRLALLSTLAFFIAGLLLLRGVNEKRGMAVHIDSQIM